VNHPGNFGIAVAIVDVFGHLTEEKPLNGIMAYLMILCGGNAHVTGLARSRSVHASLGAQAEQHSWSVPQRSHFLSGLSSGLTGRLPHRQPDLSAGAAVSRERNVRVFFYSEFFQIIPMRLSHSRF
jgi:hypothetical protein